MGITKAVFGISMQIIDTTDDNEVTDIIPMGEDLPYSHRIKPQTYVIFEVTPIYYDFHFSFQSSQSVIACALNPETGRCVTVNETITKPHLGYQGTIT